MVYITDGSPRITDKVSSYTDFRGKGTISEIAPGVYAVSSGLCNSDGVTGAW